MGSLLARAHDRSIALCDRMLGPVMDPDATFVQRWGALRFVSEQLQEHCRLEQELQNEVEALVLPELQVRLRREADQVVRLRQDVERLARGHGTARHLAGAVQKLVRALWLWYSEMEYAHGDIRPADISSRATELLNQLNYRSSLNSRPLALRGGD